MAKISAYTVRAPGVNALLVYSENGVTYNTPLLGLRGPAGANGTNGTNGTGGTSGGIDGGTASTNYGGTTPITGGGA